MSRARDSLPPCDGSDELPILPAIRTSANIDRPARAPRGMKPAAIATRARCRADDASNMIEARHLVERDAPPTSFLRCRASAMPMTPLMTQQPARPGSAPSSESSVDQLPSAMRRPIRAARCATRSRARRSPTAASSVANPANTDASVLICAVLETHSPAPAASSSSDGHGQG